MAELKIESLNCRGLFSDQIKRRDMFLRCREMYDISILVDTDSTKKLNTYGRQNGALRQYLVRGPAQAEA